MLSASGDTNMNYCSWRCFCYNTLGWGCMAVSVVAEAARPVMALLSDPLPGTLEYSQPSGQVRRLLPMLTVLKCAPGRALM